MYNRILEAGNASLLCPRCLMLHPIVFIVNEKRFCFYCAKTEEEKNFIIEQKFYDIFVKYGYKKCLLNPACPHCHSRKVFTNKKLLHRTGYQCKNCNRAWSIFKTVL